MSTKETEDLERRVFGDVCAVIRALEPAARARLVCLLLSDLLSESLSARSPSSGPETTTPAALCRYSATKRETN